MGRRLDIGIASYGSPGKLRRTVASIKRFSSTDWRLFIIDNPGPDGSVRGVIAELAAADHRIVPVLLEENVGYAGAVNKLLRLAETEYIAYCDNDIEIQTMGWDEHLCLTLDMFHEVGMVFPNSGAYPLRRDNYTEVMWGVGFCWVVNRMVTADVGVFDQSLGHQEEADYCLRVRMGGWRCAARSDVSVRHDATATSNPASIERINKGVVRWVNKWCRYFCGAGVDYYSPNVMRWEDWPPNALYLEEYWKDRIPGLNAEPESIEVEGREYDLLLVPRLKGFYRGRVI